MSEEVEKKTAAHGVVSFAFQFIALIYFHSYVAAEKWKKKIALTSLTLNKFEAKLMQCAQRAPRWCGQKFRKEEKNRLSLTQPPSQRLKKNVAHLYGYCSFACIAKSWRKSNESLFAPLFIAGTIDEINKRSCLGITHVHWALYMAQNLMDRNKKRIKKYVGFCRRSRNLLFALVLILDERFRVCRICNCGMRRNEGRRRRTLNAELITQYTHSHNGENMAEKCCEHGQRGREREKIEYK